MGRDGSKKLKVAQIKPLRSGTLGCSHTSAAEARKSGCSATFGDGKLTQCGGFDAVAGSCCDWRPNRLPCHRGCSVL